MTEYSVKYQTNKKTYDPTWNFGVIPFSQSVHSTTNSYRYNKENYYSDHNF